MKQLFPLTLSFLQLNLSYSHIIHVAAEGRDEQSKTKFLLYKRQEIATNVFTGKKIAPLLIFIKGSTSLLSTLIFNPVKLVKK